MIGIIKVFKIISIAIGVIIGLFIILVFLDKTFNNGTGRLLLPVRHKEKFQSNIISNFPRRLTVKENRIINPNGSTVILKGLMAPDPQKLDFENSFNESYYKKIFEAGGNVIRIPVHPDRWVEDKNYFWRYLDPVITWAGEYNNYVVIDLHFIGNIVTGVGSEMPEIKEKPKDFTMSFWKQTATYFKDVPNVIFEICNEPAHITSEEWYETAEEIVTAIRQTGAKQLIIVGGIDYSYDLSWVKETPIKDNNIVYATHVYPSKSNWDYYFGEISKKYPILVTEWGFIDENRYITKQQYLVGDADSFGEPFIKYLEERNIGWIACWYDDDWEPPLFSKNFKNKTNYGKFVFSKLKY